jgi:hypothetical protein
MGQLNWLIVKKKNQWVCHNVSLPFTLKRYLKAKEEELWKFDYFTMPKSSGILVSFRGFFPED